MEQLTTATLTQLPQVRALGRHTGRDPLTLFWTASGMELEFTGSELWVDLFADYEVVEPWVSVELNGAWYARFAVSPGQSRVWLLSLPATTAGTYGARSHPGTAAHRAAAEVLTAFLKEKL